MDVTPSAESLAGTAAAYPCPVEGCTRGFNRAQNLELHLRSHKEAAPSAAPRPQPDDAPAPTRRYFCPSPGCECVC